MARKIHSRYKITGTLTTQSPIHVGGIGGNADTDLALAVNGEGKYYIPGTSLAGALRAWMTTINPDITKALWGFQEEKDDFGYASFVIVEDGIIQSTLVEIRDGVAIDRYSATAAEGMKYDRAVLPRGTKIPLQLTIERDANLTDSQWETYQTLFAQLIAALKDGEIYLGAAKSRGLGKVKLYDEIIKEENLLTQEGILQILNNQQPTVDWHHLYTSHEQSRHKLDITIKWQPNGCVMVKAEGDGLAVNILPLVSHIDSHVTFVIPGSSLKGVWRSQAEKIVRTVFSQPIPDTFAEQIQLKLVNTLFGAPATIDTKDTEQTQLGYLSCLAIDDCYANIPITDNQWTSITNADSDQSLRNFLDNVGLRDTQLAYHVAIDRWTGGAADGFLYTVLEPMSVSWQPITLSLNLHRLNKSEKEQEYYPSLALFFLVLRDFMNSQIPIGFGTNRGMGAINVTEVEIKGKGIPDEFSTLSATKLEKFYDLDKELLGSLNKYWQNWIQEG